jgi:hypothetical protein
MYIRFELKLNWKHRGTFVGVTISIFQTINNKLV